MQSLTAPLRESHQAPTVFMRLRFLVWLYHRPNIMTLPEPTALSANPLETPCLRAHTCKDGGLAWPVLIPEEAAAELLKHLHSLLGGH